jgi:hypothetical protein
MPKYDPPELEANFQNALNTWLQTLGLNSEQEAEFIGLDTETDEETVHTPQTEIYLRFPEDHDDSWGITYTQFIEISQELPSISFVNNLECWTNKRYLLRVEPVNAVANEIAWNAMPDPTTDAEATIAEQYIHWSRRYKDLMGKLNAFPGRGAYPATKSEFDSLLDEWGVAQRHRSELRRQITQWTQRRCIQQSGHSGSAITCSITSGYTAFGLAVIREKIYDENTPPFLDEQFVEAVSDGRLNVSEARSVAQAYLFELSSSLGADFRPSARLELESYDPNVDDEYVPRYRFRPLLLGKGMTHLLELYNHATAYDELEMQVFHFTKVLEYISQTVVQQQFTEAVRSKLLSPRALAPDAAYMFELAQVIEDTRTLKKDKEALRATVIACCDAIELARFAPPFMKELAAVTLESKAKDRDDALGKFGASISATRNQIAHSKANYSPTSEECPANELAAFSLCLRHAAQQAIRWYHSRPESNRIASM